MRGRGHHWWEGMDLERGVLLDVTSRCGRFHWHCSASECASQCPCAWPRYGIRSARGWDQSDKFVKIYITLKGVQNISADNLQVHFSERSFELLVNDLNGKNHTMTVNNLLKPISPEGSTKKVKTDTVLIMCRKKSEQKWEFLTQVEKQTKEKEKPPLDTDGDPSAGLMNVLKKIYDEGDDEMKRTLNKAWVESREKQMKGDQEF
ncbi:calcyclin binding protein L homeolog isoform X2 [Xenopus laevis]|uniref:Calcyclin binding protein L homeolog isoform X2 n=1 Tax=Xenopus laevis TaxID=8355 RepID=A0A8J1MTU4_XENLA|nr:calcyclin binding protein L homeolog isoform X2 [Xenopus laevis]